MTSILGWLGKNFASGIVGAVGGEAYSEILTLASLQQDTVAIQLQQISGQLNQINLSIDALRNSLEALHAELSYTTEEIKVQITESQCAPAAQQLHGDFGVDDNAAGLSPESLLGLAVSAQQGPQQQAATTLKRNIDTIRSRTSRPSEMPSRLRRSARQNPYWKMD
jgi:hypothetical protein